MEDRRRGPRRLLVHVGHTWMPLPVGEWVVGRAPDADIRIDDDRVSRRHAVVRAVETGWELADGGSLNGIWYEGRQVQRVSVPPGGLDVRIGGKDGVPVRLLPDRTREGRDESEPAEDLPPVAGPAPAPGTMPAGVRFQQVTPDWTGWEQTGADAGHGPGPHAEGGDAGEPAVPGRIRAFVREAGRRVARRDGGS